MTKEARKALAEMDKDTRKQFVEAFGEIEELDPELERYKVVTPTVGTWIKHPLVYSMMHTDLLNGMINGQYRQKLSLLAKLEKEKRYFAIPFVYERPYRLSAFQRIETHLSDADYWLLLSQIWTDSENIFQNEEEWREAFESDRPGRLDHLMEEDEREVYAALPDVLTVFRGYSHEGRSEGLSWTQRESTAEWFAQRLSIGGIVVEGKVKKEHVLAAFTSRKEAEIVVFPELVTDREEREV